MFMGIRWMVNLAFLTVSLKNWVLGFGLIFGTIVG